MPADVQTNCGGSPAHVQWFSCQKLEQTIVTSLYDIMRVSCAIVGGNYKREDDRASGLLHYCCLGVSTQAFGSLTSHRPSTLAVSVPLKLET